MSLVYIIFFILSIALLILLMTRYYNRISPYYVLLFAAVVVEDLGYMQGATAPNLEAAVYANQVAYIGASTIPYFLFMCIADLCKEKISSVAKISYLVLATTVFFFASTVGVTEWYYTRVELIQDGGLSFLDKTNGPAHGLFSLYLASILIYSTYIIIKSFQKRRSVSYIISIMMVVIMLNVVVVYAVEKMMHYQFELVPFAYIISEIILLFLLRRVSLYDVAAISAASMVNSMDYGFVIFDSKGRYLGSDDAAKMWFDELAMIPIDRVLPKTNSPLFIQLNKWKDNLDNRNVLHINNVDGLIIEARDTIINDSKHNPIHCVYLRDETKHQKYDKLIKKYNEDLAKDVGAKTEQLKQVQEDIIISMASIVENRDNNTGGHIKRTSDIVKLFVTDLRRRAVCQELTPAMAEYITKAAPLHDFGKIAIPDKILNKDGKFEDWEYEIMKEHSAKGAVIVERILQNSQDAEFKKVAVNVAHYHHEKWDGRGYPEGLSGEDIPFEARVMALADVFDALVSKRVYKEKFSYDKAFGIIEESLGSHFDPKLCKEFLSLRPRLEELYNSYPEE